MLWQTSGGEGASAQTKHPIELTALGGCGGRLRLDAGQRARRAGMSGRANTTPKTFRTPLSASRPRSRTYWPRRRPGLITDFPDRSRPRDIRFGIGDILSVTIFEASSGGLFIPAEAVSAPAISLPFLLKL